MAAALELLHIRKSFGSLVALDDVSLTIRAGSIHGLLGENGAGKSTLMNLAYGLLRPDSGQVGVRIENEVTVEGKKSSGFGLQGSADQNQESRSRDLEITGNWQLATAKTSGSLILHPSSIIRSPADAIAAGIGMVHQHFMLAGPMTVLDNVLLGDRRAGRWLIRRTAARSLQELALSSGLPVDPLARVDELSVGQQQRVEILKALWRDVRILILDEPTAVLTPVETAQLFAAVKKIRDHGCAVVFISHKLREVRQLCDRLTILRRGRIAWEGTPQQASDEELARKMMEDQEGSGLRIQDSADARQQAGRATTRLPSTLRLRPEGSSPKSAHQLPTAGGFEAEQTGDDTSTAHPSYAKDTAALRLENVSGPGLNNVSLVLASGTILGIAGVDGNGQQELAETIVGLRRPGAGKIFFGDEQVTSLPLRRRLELGLAHIPNDRTLEALVPEMSLWENLYLKRHNHPPMATHGIQRPRAARAAAGELRRQFDIRAPDVTTAVASLSGGNQQKVVLARELAIASPRLLVAMNPARGLDPNATRFVHQQLRLARARGCAILLISSELDELLELADRIAVLYGGELTMTDFPQTAREHIGRLMTGLK